MSSTESAWSPDTNMSAASLLKKQLYAGSYAHAYFFYGPPDAGKRATAGYFTQALLCESQVERPCGLCVSCVRSRAGTHPDVVTVTLSKDASNITVDQVRDFHHQLFLKPALGRHRLGIINASHRLNSVAANALLKILEEPPAHAVIILIADMLAQLPATVLSRCQLVKFRADVDKDTPEESADESDLITQAIQVLSVPLDQKIQQLRTMLESAARAEAGDVDHDDPEKLIGHIESLMRALLLYKVLPVLSEQMRHRAHVSKLDKIISARSAYELLNAVRELRTELAYHVSPKLAWDNFLIKI